MRWLFRPVYHQSRMTEALAGMQSLDDKMVEVGRCLLVPVTSYPVGTNASGSMSNCIWGFLTLQRVSAVKAADQNKAIAKQCRVKCD